MPQLNQRERLGLGITATAVLILGLGSFVYSNHGSAGLTPGSPALAPVSEDGRKIASSLEIPAGGSDSARPVTAGTPPAGDSAPSPLIVHVVGAVRNPGVYHLRPGDRIIDAVRAAGGFASGAAEDALNLADRAQDADQIYIPRRNEISSVAPAASPAGHPHPYVAHGTRAIAATASIVSGGSHEPKAGRVIGRTGAVPQTAEAYVPSITPPPFITGGLPSHGRASRSSASAPPKKFHNPGDGIVHLNTATLANLQSIPGVGESTAARILEYRGQIGQFTSVDQILDIRGIGQKKFEKMQPFLTL